MVNAVIRIVDGIYIRICARISAGADLQSVPIWSMQLSESLTEYTSGFVHALYRFSRNFLYGTDYKSAPAENCARISAGADLQSVPIWSMQLSESLTQYTSGFVHVRYRFSRNLLYGTDYKSAPAEFCARVSAGAEFQSVPI
jgi:hypothetical protein